MFTHLLYSNFSYEIKYHVSYNKQHFWALATNCKRSHVDKLNGAPVGPFGARIEIKKNPVFRAYNTTWEDFTLNRSHGGQSHWKMNVHTWR